ncbi:hypothetical protein BDV10DRAFT_177993 [Aspergillus recurvatus]
MLQLPNCQCYSVSLTSRLSYNLSGLYRWLSLSQRSRRGRPPSMALSIFWSVSEPGPVHLAWDLGTPPFCPLFLNAVYGIANTPAQDDAVLFFQFLPVNFARAPTWPH